jgi:hypothetical protein
MNENPEFNTISTLQLDVDFGADSLFCEYAYVLDMDNNVLEFYRGFQKKPHGCGRWATMPVVRPEDKEKYYPIKLMFSIPFSEIKENGLEALLSRISEEEEEEKEDEFARPLE